MLKEVKLHLFDTGYCLNFEKMVARDRPMKIERFYALVGLIEHPTFGPILFDTGYSSHVIQLCRRFPYLFYALITPIRFENSLSAANQIQKFGYKPEDIQHVILSHFHPDHIGGLKDFTSAQFYCSKNAYAQLRKLSFLGSLREVFFTDLLPHNFETRLHEIEINPLQLPFEPFAEGFDLFRDQSLVAVNLPGHACGQIGIFLKTSSQIVLLAADACWQTSNYVNLEEPHPLAKAAICDYKVFCETLHKLKELNAKHPEVLIIPSHCQKMWARYVKEGQTC